MTQTLAIRRAFPSMPPQILDLFEHGDLQRVIPDWIVLFSKFYDNGSSAYTSDQRVRLAWLDVLAEYDRIVEAKGDGQ